MNTTAAYHQAAKAIAAGEAEAYALWVLLSDEHQRDGYGLKPMPWEGPGEYQHVKYGDGRDGFVRIPGCKSLPCTNRFAKEARPEQDPEPDDLIRFVQWVVGQASGQHADPWETLRHIAEQAKATLAKAREPA